MLKDLRYAFRTMAQRPGFALLIIAMLALGIGANTTIFSVVDALVLRPFSFPNQDRLVALNERKLEIGVRRAAVAPGNLSDWRARGRSFEDLVALRTEEFDLRSGGLPERYAGYRVSVGFFKALGVQPLLGRGFQPEDAGSGSDPVVVLKHSIWERRFASDPDIVGQAITLNNISYVVIGVMHQEFTFPADGGELWTPLVIEPASMEDRGSHYLRVMGLLRPGVSIEHADQEVRALMQQAQEKYPATNAGIDAYVVGLNEDYTRGSRTYLPIMIASVAMVLLIACANAANLLLVRASARQREIAVRMALGASRWRIVRQLLTESVVLGLLAGAAGLGLTYWGVIALAHGIPEGFSRFIPGWNHLAVSRATFLFTLCIALGTGVLFGLLPAWQASRMNLNEVLKSGGRGTAGGLSARWRNSLVVAEIALSFVLLISAGLLIRSFVAIFQSDFGFDSSNAVSLRIVLPAARYSDREQRGAFFADFLARVAAVPGVSRTGAVDTLPLSGRRNSSSFQIAGQPPFPAATQPHTEVNIATPGYFAAVGTPLRSGRLFTEADTARSPSVALVNEAFAKRYLPGRNAIGEHLLFGGTFSVEIIGTVANVINEDLDDLNQPAIYQPHAQLASAGMALVVRGDADSTQIVGGIRKQLAEMDATIAISDVKTLDEIVAERSSPKRLLTAMLGIFALIALTLAMIGLYAVTSYTVELRNREMGIRMALGARDVDVLSLVLRQSLRLSALGLALGVAGAIGVSGLLGQMLYGVTGLDPMT
ncbi:MAG: ABC transporter permease, partial [Acidobacteriota bacterium]